VTQHGKGTPDVYVPMYNENPAISLGHRSDERSICSSSLALSPMDTNAELQSFANVLRPTWRHCGTPNRTQSHGVAHANSARIVTTRTNHTELSNSGTSSAYWDQCDYYKAKIRAQKKV